MNAASKDVQGRNPCSREMGIPFLREVEDVNTCSVQAAVRGDALLREYLRHVPSATSNPY